MSKPTRAWRETITRPGKRDGFRIRWRAKDPESGKVKKHTSELIESAKTAGETLSTINAALENEWKKKQVTARHGNLLTLNALFTRWRDSRLASGEIREPYAHEAENAWKSILQETGWQTLADITPEAIDQWIVRRKGKGVQKPHLVLRSVLHFAHDRLRQPVDTHALAISPVRGTEKPQPSLLTDQQIAMIRARASEFGPQIMALIDHLSLFGCRPVDANRSLIARWRRADRLMVRVATDTKNRKAVMHPVPEEHARLLDRITAGRSQTDHIFLHPSGEPWKLSKIGGAAQMGDWYWNNITTQIPEILPEQRGIYVLKDYAITRMELAGIDDKTKTTFTGIRTLSVYQRYKATNRQRQLDALEALPVLPTLAPKAQGAFPAQGAESGAIRPRGKNGGNK